MSTRDIYTTKRLSSGQIKRTPVKILPTMPLIPAIQRIFLHPGKVEELQQWRQDNDQPERISPLANRGWDAFPDLDFRMHDIYDGWGWRAIQAGLERRKGGKWGIKDVDVRQLNQRFTSLPCGLVFMFNIDW